jgi:tetratricopeptide (TPR) repeat protein
MSSGMSAFILLSLLLGSSAVAAPAPKPAKPSFSAALEAFKKEPSDANREALIKAGRGRAVPEEAERRMARGAAAIADAKMPADFLAAAAEFEGATNAAPWWGDAYYNLGVAYDKGGQPAKALAALKSALAADPGSKDVKTLLYQVEFRAEKARDSLKRLEGDWYQLDAGKTKANAATWDDYSRHWSLKSHPGGAKLWISHERFNGQVKLRSPEEAAIVLTATLKDGVMTWESTDRYGECGRPHTAPARVSVRDDGAVIEVRLEQLIPRRGMDIEGDSLRAKGVAFVNFDSACVVGQNFPYRLGRGE